MSSQDWAAQKQLLRQCIAQRQGTHFGRRTGLAALDPSQEFAFLYEAFVQHTQVQSWPLFIEGLRQLAEAPQATPEQLYLQPQLLLAQAPRYLARGRQGVYPLAAQGPLEAVVRLGQALEMLPGLPQRLRGELFVLPENAGLEIQDKYTVGDVRMVQLLAASRGRLPRPTGPAPQDLIRAGKSRLQVLHLCWQVLQQRGAAVGVLWASPQRLAELSLMAAQQAGQAVPLRQLCPQLQLVVADGGDLSLYHAELQHFMAGLPAVVLPAFTAPIGVLALPYHAQQPGVLALALAAGTFYEFVPLEQLRSDGTVLSQATRFQVDNVPVGGQYALVVTTLAGLTAVNTGDVVQVVQRAPLLLRYVRRAELLSPYQEQLSAAVVTPILAAIATALAPQGIFLRDYVLGVDVAARAPLWAIEINRPPQEVGAPLLGGVVTRLHQALLEQHPPYRQAFLGHRLQLPQCTFLPPGSLAQLPPQARLSYLDTSATAALVKQACSLAGLHALAVTANQV